MSDVAPPASAIWYDIDETVAAVLAVLRLTDADVDAARIETLVPVAGLLIDEFVDACDPVLPPPAVTLQEALLLQTVWLYRAKDTAPGQPGLSFDVRKLILAAKRRWGVA